MTDSHRWEKVARLSELQPLDEVRLLIGGLQEKTGTITSLDSFSATVRKDDGGTELVAAMNLSGRSPVPGAPPPLKIDVWRCTADNHGRQQYSKVEVITVETNN